MIYGLLADVIVFIHVAYVAYVVVGQLLITVGWPLGWKWTRNFWFRLTHLVAIGFVAFEEAIGMVCPLTAWEQQLRMLAGQEVQTGTFMGRLFHSLIFYNLPAHYFTWMHVGFAALVLATFVLYPPRRPWRRPTDSQGGDDARHHCRDAPLRHLDGRPHAQSRRA